MRVNTTGQTWWRPLGLRLVFFWLLVVGLSGCAYSPKTDVYGDAGGADRLPVDARVATLIAGDEDDDLPGCFRETVRRRYPDGPDLEIPALGDEVRGWIGADPPGVTRRQLTEAAKKAGADISALGGDVSHIAILSGRSSHDDTTGEMDGVNVIVVINVDHVTFLGVDVFDLASGERVRHLRSDSRGQRTYGIAGVFPIIGYSDTDGAACEALDDALGNAG